MDNFVVYAYVRSGPDRFGRMGTFYYIGKGKPGRPYSKNRSKTAKRPSDDSKILILHRDLNEQTAFEYEKKLILFYGRIDNTDFGVLRNLTDGGEGASGTVVTQDTKEKMSKSHLGANSYNYTPKDWYHPDHGEVIQKSSRELSEIFPEMNLNVRCLDAVFRKEKTNHKGWKRLDDKGQTHRRKNHISRDWYHKDHGILLDKSITELVKLFTDLQLSVSGLCQVCTGKSISHKGWYLLENKDKKRINYKPHDWYHPEFGAVTCKTVPELCKLFPNQKLQPSGLNRVAIGSHAHHKGWSIYKEDSENLDFIPPHNKYKPVNWFHPAHGKVEGKSLSELVSMFPEEKLHRGCLSQVANGILRQHKGWTLS
jgi:hypothetical protein